MNVDDSLLGIGSRVSIGRLVVNSSATRNLPIDCIFHCLQRHQETIQGARDYRTQFDVGEGILTIVTDLGEYHTRAETTICFEAR